MSLDFFPCSYFTILERAVEITPASYMSKCLNPIRFRSSQGYTPCGSCDACIKNKRSQMQFRLKSAFNYFGKIGSMITLTYDDKFLPMSHTVKPFGVVSKSDINKFKKRFKTAFKRKYGRSPVFIHYGIAEYSPTLLRPHYHIFTVGDDASFVEYISKKVWKFGHVNVDSINFLDDKATKKSLGARASYVIGHNFKEDSYIDKLSSAHTKPFSVKSRGIGFELLPSFVPRFIANNMIPVQGFTRYERWLLLNHSAFEGLDISFSEWSGLVKTCSQSGGHFIDVHAKFDDEPSKIGIFSPAFKGVISFITPYMIRKIARLIDSDIVDTLEYIVNNEPVPLHYASVLESDIVDSISDYNDYIGSEDHSNSIRSIGKYLRLRKAKKSAYAVKRIK